MSGIIPAPVSFSELRLAEVYSPTIKPGSNLGILEVTRYLTRRKLYCYVFAQSTSATAILSGRIDVYNNSSKIGELPFFAAENNPFSKPAFSPFITGGTPIGDAIFLQPAFSKLLPATSFSPAESPTNILQPFEIKGECDSFGVSVDTVLNITGARIVFVCASSK